MQVLLALTACCSGVGCSSAQKHMETVNKMGERPFVIAFRSYSGSQESLILAAKDLLNASGTIRRGGGGSEYQWYHDEERKRDFVVQAVVFKTELPVEGILVIKMDLMWVEGVEMETPELHLPSPLIFEKYWANRVFVEASEDVMFRSRDEGREKTSVVRRIAQAYKKYHDMDDSAVTFFYETNELSPPELSRKPGGTIYSQEAVDDLNMIAVAGNLLLFAEVDVTHERDPQTPKDETDRDACFSDQDLLEKLPRDTMLALEVPIEATATVDVKAQAWVDGLAGLLAVHHFVGARTVIYAVDATRISGAVIGHPAANSKPYFHRRDVAVSSERAADMPINRNAQEEARDCRLVTLSTLYHPHALPASE
jgi:hypothetical protein